jgi:hypothetical protein
VDSVPIVVTNGIDQAMQTRNKTYHDDRAWTGSSLSIPRNRTRSEAKDTQTERSKDAPRQVEQSEPGMTVEERHEIGGEKSQDSAVLQGKIARDASNDG